MATVKNVDRSEMKRKETKKSYCCTGLVILSYVVRLTWRSQAIKILKNMSLNVDVLAGKG